ncbi:hypothetical protein SK854_06255 [Lentzea sp. BCCO 10_0061]|uniref:DUF1963 domain-containing protein n=1 Tax=Lentzea sokolovensis TaxID=3095429 RepID=A0ABU4UQF3_9PSEU|nr:hypothetical protein [Lentzea sp. BCCO 10_0061]MDX8141704.1 hypothetical protein [Lentzea sp. BCCO 10_0061]
MEMEELLWRLADNYAPARPAYSVATRPTWFDHAGDLVVLNSPITWETPWRTEGGFTHRLPVGSHPVHVGSTPFTPDGEDPDASWHTVSMVVIPLAEPSRIAAADWNVPGYDDSHFIEDYAVLWGEEAMRASLPHDADGTPAFVRDARDDIRARGPRQRQDNWTNVVLEQETGANAFVLPVHDADYVTGWEIVDDQSNLLCLVLAACE